jgi:uncharacterized oxidoreductase
MQKRAAAADGMPPRETFVQVIELPPPLVATDLTPNQRANPRAMPLDEYLKREQGLFAEGQPSQGLRIDQARCLPV